MTSTIDSDRTAKQEVRKHPIRGAIWGLFLGLGVAAYLVLFAVIAFGDWIPFGVCVVAGISLGVVWASIAPPKQPKGPPPAMPTANVAEVPATPTEKFKTREFDADTPPGDPLDLTDPDPAPADPAVADLPPPPPTPTAG